MLRGIRLRLARMLAGGPVDSAELEHARALLAASRRRRVEDADYYARVVADLVRPMVERHSRCSIESHDGAEGESYQVTARIARDLVLEPDARKRSLALQLFGGIVANQFERLSELDRRVEVTDESAP